MKKIPIHSMSSIGLKYIGLDHVTKYGHTYRISTIHHLSSKLYETAINLNPEERYHNLKDAKRGHKKYVLLVQKGWIPYSSR